METTESIWIGTISGLAGATLGIVAAILGSYLSHKRESRGQFNELLIKGFELIEDNEDQRAHGISILKSLSSYIEYKSMMLAGLGTQAVNLLVEIPDTNSRIEQRNLFSILEFLRGFNDEVPDKSDIFLWFKWNWYLEVQNALLIRVNKEKNIGDVRMPDDTLLHYARTFKIHEFSDKYGQPSEYRDEK